MPDQLPPNELAQKIQPVLNLDKVIELDFSVARDETKQRTEFNRRILSLQLSTISALIAAGLFKDLTTFDPFVIHVACCSVIFLNTVFLLEINQNNFYIALSALCISQIVNIRSQQLLFRARGAEPLRKQTGRGRGREDERQIVCPPAASLFSSLKPGSNQSPFDAKTQSSSLLALA